MSPPAWLLAWITSKDVVETLDEAVCLLLPVPPGSYDKSSIEYRIALSWLLKCAVLPGEPNGFRIHVRHLVSMVQRHSPPGALGQDLVDAWNVRRSQAPSVEVALEDVQEEGDLLERRIAALRRLLEDFPDAKNPPCPGFESRQDFFDRLYEREPALWLIKRRGKYQRITVGSFVRHFWFKQDLVRFPDDKS